MELEVRYCTTGDGVRIAYCIEGDGLPLVLCPFFIESISLHHLIPELPTFLESLGDGRMLVRYDGRGTGLSDREFAPDAVPVFGRESFLSDLSAVADACGLSSFAIWASGTAGPGAVEYTARHPDRVSHLILFNTFASVRSATPGGRPLDQSSAEALASLCELNWPLAAQTFADMTLRQEFPEAALGGAKSSTGRRRARRWLKGFGLWTRASTYHPCWARSARQPLFCIASKEEWHPSKRESEWRARYRRRVWCHCKARPRTTRSAIPAPS